MHGTRLDKYNKYSREGNLPSYRHVIQLGTPQNADQKEPHGILCRAQTIRQRPRMFLYNYKHIQYALGMFYTRYPSPFYLHFGMHKESFLFTLLFMIYLLSWKKKKKQTNHD